MLHDGDDGDAEVEDTRYQGDNRLALTERHLFAPLRQ